MNLAQGYYFDGLYARRHEVRILLTGDRLKVVGAEVDGDYPAREVRVSQRIARIPRWIYLPDGGTCVVEDRKLLRRLTRESALERTLRKWESRPAYAAIALALLAVCLWLMIDRGLPIVAEQVAEHIPLSAETTLAEQALGGMDRYVLKPSALSGKRQQTLRAKFDQMASRADPVPSYRLEFRSSPALGPNAFTLPAGIIVVTDELIAIAHGDREVLAVLAHELGHVRHRHVMRHLLEGSATALIIAGVTGDIASTTSLAASAPALLIQVKFSRDYEREADRYALDLLQRSNIDPRYFAAVLKRLDAFMPSRSGASTFLSSHPSTEERRALALQGNVADLEEDDEKDTADQTQAEPQSQAAAGTTLPVRVQLAEPDKAKIVALLEQRDYDELERALQAYQTAFEDDPGTSVRLEAAFAPFAKVPLAVAPRLDEWVAQRPSSYAAAVARGNYHLNRGLDARGTKLARDTPDTAISEMRDQLRTARVDLDRSLALTGKPYLSHRYLLQIERQVGNAHQRRSQYEQAIRWAPQSIEVRLSYMGTLEPRWGGSYPDMEAFLSASRSELKDPQSVQRLAARIPANHGDDARHEKDYSRALLYYTEAAELDATADNLCNRAQTLSELKRYDESLKDAGRAFALHDAKRPCTSTVFWVAQEVPNAQEAIDILGKVIDSDPSAVQAFKTRGWRYVKTGKHELAFQDYLNAAKLGDAWAQNEVAKMYWAGQGVAPDREESLAWARKAAAQGNAESQKALERVLGKSEKK